MKLLQLQLVSEKKRIGFHKKTKSREKTLDKTGCIRYNTDDESRNNS